MTTRPWKFAWVDESDSTFDMSFAREDEQIISLVMEHDEGDFPSLKVTVINPRIGLLNPGRKVWAWLAYDPRWTPETVSSEESEGEIVPIFFGRLLGIPEDLDGETVQLSFIGRPSDYIDQQWAIADTLMAEGAPYFDPIWFDSTGITVDSILESRPALWHVDPVTHVVSISNINDGEDGTLTVDSDECFYDSLKVSYGNAALRQVTMTATVSWTQTAAGLLPSITPGTFQTYTGKGDQDNWPTPGISIGAGWSVGASFCNRIGGDPVIVEGAGGTEMQGTTAQRTPCLGWYTWRTWPYTIATIDGPQFGNGPGADSFTSHESTDLYVFICPGGQIAFTGIRSIATVPAIPQPDTLNQILQIPMWTLETSLQPAYSASRSRSEVLTFTLGADVQSILTDPDGSEGGTADTLALTMSSSNLTTPDSEGNVVIGDPSAASYFSTDRGDQSIQYLLMVARANLLSAARCVNVSLTVGGAFGISLHPTCRKNLVLNDERLPGGQAAGKITSYTLTMDGDSGQFTMDFTIGCTIGKAGTVEATAGDPTYCTAGYVSDGYQQMVNKYVLPGSGDVLYESQNGIPPNDDGVDFQRMSLSRCLIGQSVVTDPDNQKAVLANAFLVGDQSVAFASALSAKSTDDVFAVLNTAADTFDYELIPLDGGPFETDYNVATSLLKVPKTFDTEADSVSS